MTDRAWEEAARALTALRTQMEQIGVETAVQDVWLRPYVAALADRFDGTQDVPGGFGLLTEACAAKAEVN